MERKVPFIEGEFYHLYNRGVDKRTIFLSAQDYKRFLILLYLANSTKDVRLNNVLKTYSYKDILEQDREAPLVSIGAYCLMPNHFHLLVTPRVKNGLSHFMLKLQTGYSMYFNTRNERSGSLFQGPFKSTHVTNDQQLRYLYAYIHLNPAKLKEPKWKEGGVLKKAALTTYVESYPYSSYSAYINNAHSITDPASFPDYFSSRGEVRSHIKDWLN